MKVKSAIEHSNLSRREREIMEVLYEISEASAQQVLERIPSPPSYSAVRAMLSKLEKKGHIEHFYDGQRYIYSATLAEKKVRKTALKKLVKIFFGGSHIDAAAALLGMNQKLDEDDIRKLQSMVDKAKKDNMTSKRK